MILYILPLLFSFTELDKKYQYSFDKPKKVSRPKKRRAKSKLDTLLYKLNESDQRINSLLELNEKKVIVKRTTQTLSPLTRLDGFMMNSIISTNKRATTILVRLDPNEFFEEAEVRCSGANFSKRVVAKCDLIVADNKSYEVNASLWDLDGAEGIIADEFYTGEEKDFLTSSFSNFFEGVVEGAKEKVLTPFGDLDRRNGKNQILNGLGSIASGINTKVKDSSEKNISVSMINSGKRVVLFFNKGVKL